MFTWQDLWRRIQAYVDKTVERALRNAGIYQRTIDAGVLRGELNSGIVLPDHAPEHEAGGSDEIDLGFLAGTLNDAQHGARAGGTLHALASAVANGFMSAAHFARVNAVTSFIDTLLDDADAAAARTTLGVIAGGAGDIWVEKAGDTMSGDLTISKANAVLTLLSSSGSSGANLNVRADVGNANLNFDSTGATQSQLNLRKMISGSPSLRWAVIMTNTAESGSNVGSNLSILRRTDAGASLGNPVISIERATGFVGINRTEATALYPMDVNGVTRATAFRDTTYGKDWKFGAYTAGTVVATGRIRIEIDGTLYDIDAKAV